MAATLRVKPYPAELAAKPARIAVTGSTGFLASNIVHRLLSLGHTVHGTCRDPAKAKALQVGMWRVLWSQVAGLTSC